MSGFQTSKNSYGGGAGRYVICEVVDRKNDPEQSGRVQVRVVGYQNDEGLIPKADLRWARIKHSPTNPMKNGVGGPAVGLLEGSYVYAFFADGDAAQQLVIDGSMGAPATKDGGKEKSDIPPHTRTNKDSGDLRWNSKSTKFEDKSITEYAKNESKNAFDEDSSKDADETGSWSLGMAKYEA